MLLYSLELPHRGASNEYTHHYMLEDKKKYLHKNTPI